MPKQGVSITNFPMGRFIQTADGAEQTTGTPTGAFRAGAASGALTGSAAYDATAKVWIWSEVPAAAMNAAVVGLTFDLAACLPIAVMIPTEAKLVSDLVDAAAAPSASTVASQVRTELTTELARIDAAVTTRHASGAAVAKSPATLDWAADVSNKPAIGTSTLDATGVRTAVGLASANLDTQLTGLPTDQDVRDAMKLAPTAGAPAAASVDAHLDDILLDTGTTLPAQIITGAGGGGAISTPITITDGINPLDGVEVWVTTDAAGLHVIASGTTDALGLVTFMLDAGSYFVWKQLAGYNFTNPQALVV